ncbi:hypothetical protein [uncultured Bilophila sp.]|nr:hypothetical protein [uncultured Bilophila sp.]
MKRVQHACRSRFGIGPCVNSWMRVRYAGNLAPPPATACFQ